MSRLRKKRRLVAEMNVVPYIDVMLVLLVIFMITTPLLNQGVNIKLPSAKAKVLSSKQQEPLIVSIDNKGQFFLNVSSTPDVPMPMTQLLTRVAAEIQIAKRQGDRRQVLVKGDERANYGEIVQAMVMLQQAGVDSVGLMTKIPKVG